MLINKHDCYSILFEMQSQGTDVHKEFKQLMIEDKTPKTVVTYLKDNNYPVIEFYLNLNNKAHKIIKEVLTCEGKPVSNYIKIATSIITQATITIEHTCHDDINAQNKLIENLHLRELTHGLNDYFTTGDWTELVKTVHETRQDVKYILDD